MKKNQHPKATAFTNSLRNVLQRDLQNAAPMHRLQLFRQYEAELKYYRKQFEKIPDSLSRAVSLHKAVDKAIAADPAEAGKKEITCKAGCSACCHVSVAAIQDEAELLIAYAKDKEIEIDWQKVERQSQVSEDEDAFFNLAKSESACVFLNQETGLCKVYEIRPASCRKYFVADDPKKCGDKSGTEVRIWVSRTAEFVMSGAMEVDHDRCGSLPAMLLKAKKESEGAK